MKENKGEREQGSKRTRVKESRIKRKTLNGTTWNKKEEEGAKEQATVVAHTSRGH